MTNASGGDITLTAIDGTSDVVIHEDIWTVGGFVDINAGQDVTSTSGDDITTTAAADSGTVSGAVDIDAARNVDLAGNIVTTGANHSVADATASAGGQVDVTTADGWIVVASITASGGNATGGGTSVGGASAAINLTSGDAGADATQDITIGLLTAVGRHGDGGRCKRDGDADCGRRRGGRRRGCGLWTYRRARW